MVICGLSSANSVSTGHTLLLSSANEFGYLVNVTNSGADDGLNPSLLVQLPNGVIFNRSVSHVISHVISESHPHNSCTPLRAHPPHAQVSVSPSAITECATRTISETASDGFSTNIECFLRNPVLAGVTLELEMFFLLNVSAIPLSTSSLDIVFSVVDGVTGNRSDSVSRSVGLEAIGAYGITSV